MKKPGILRITTYIAAGLLPVAVILFGLWLPTGGSIVTGCYAITFFILPVLVLVGCACVIQSRLHPVLRGLLCVLFLAVLVVGMMFMLTIGQFSILTELTGDAALEQYENVADTVPEFPAASALGQPENVEYYHFFNVFGTFFDSDCDILICGYAESEYPRQKEMLEVRHTFRLEPATAHGASVEPGITLDGYEFRMLEYKDENPGYPKRMVYVATNDAAGEIIYLYYTDDDIDWIESMEKHIQDYFGWKYIR